MMIINRRKSGWFSLAAAVAVATLLAGPASAASDDDTTVIDGVVTDAPVATAAELDAYIQSSTPKTVVQDVQTGEFVEVREGVSPSRDARSVQKGCSPGNLCLNPYMTPYANYGFWGVGTNTGSWSYLKSWSTGSWRGKVTVGGVTTQAWVGKNTLILFNTYPVTVTKVQLS